MGARSGHFRGVVRRAESATRPGAAGSGSLTLRDLFDGHADFVFRVLRRLGVAECDLDDAAQDVFVVIHRNLSQYDHQSALRSWLFGILYRVASGYRRRTRRRREDMPARLPVQVVQPSQLEELEFREAQRLLLDALDQIEPAPRAVFVLYELEEMDMPEVAAALGCPPQTAYSRLYAARAGVRAHILRAHRRRRAV
jgi:RNA polymerase sigma-70 factor (ECF subfamily)